MIADMYKSLNKYFERTPAELVAYAQAIQDYFDANLPFEVVQVRALPAAERVRVELVSHDYIFTVYRVIPQVSAPILAELMRHYCYRVERIRDGELEPPAPTLEPDESRRKLPRVEAIPLTPDADGYIYVIRGGDLCKIGVSINPNQRLRTLNSASPVLLKFEMCEPHPNMFVGESTLHSRYEKKRVKGEWFNLTDADLNDIREFLLKAKARIRP